MRLAQGKDLRFEPSPAGVLWLLGFTKPFFIPDLSGSSSERHSQALDTWKLSGLDLRSHTAEGERGSRLSVQPSVPWGLEGPDP